MRLLQTLEHPNIIRYLDSFLLRPSGGDGDHHHQQQQYDNGVQGQGQGSPAAGGHHGNELVIVVEWAAAGDLRRQLRKAAEVSSCRE